MTGRQERLENAIDDCVEDHRDEAIALLRDLIRVPSYSGSEGVAVDPDSVVGKVYQAAAGHGTEVDVQPVGRTSENVVEVVHGTGERAFILEAHVDIVPEGEPQRWFDAEPFSGAEGHVEYLGHNRIAIEVGSRRAETRIRDQMAQVWERKRQNTRRPIIYGRGSFDNKGPVIAVLLAQQALFEALRATGEQLNGAVIATYAVDEETDSSGVKRFACDPDSWLARHGYLDGPADRSGFMTEVSGVALEGSYGWAPVVGHRGTIQLAITVHGQAAHAATPHLGVSAVEQMARLLLCLHDGADELRDRLLTFLDPSLLGPPTFAVGTTIAGGGVRSTRTGPAGREVVRSGVNSIPDWCEATVDIRFPNGPRYPADTEEAYRRVPAEVRAYLEGRVRTDGWSYEVRVIEGSESPPVSMAPSLSEASELPLVRSALLRAQQVLGYRPDLAIAPGRTDATFMIHEAGIPTLVELGPAGGLSHDVHEFVEREDIIAGAKILALMAVDALGLAD